MSEQDAKMGRARPGDLRRTAIHAGGTEDTLPGYKRTEVGVIPEDWRVAPIGELADVYRGASPRPIDSPVWFDQRSGTGWLRISDVTAAGKYVENTVQKLSPAGVSNSRFVKSDSLVMSICATVGRPVITKRDVCIHDGFVVFDKLLADKEYFFYILSSLETSWSKHGQTGSQMNLNTGIINFAPVPLPPPPEQRAIAEALSDVDRLLQVLDELVAKKRSIKQATLQQLLTGKTRLPGFQGEWIELNIARDSMLKARIGWQGLTTAEYLSNGNYHLVTGTDLINGRINWESCFFVDHSRFVQDTNIQLNLSDVLLTKDGTIGKVAFIDSLPRPATLNSGIFVIRPKAETYFSKYLYYVLTSRIFENFLTQLQAGSTISHLYQKDLVSFTFEAPSIDEQRAIATVLSDMDAEIAALEARRDKTRAIKQGMMQQLLTGRVRLVRGDRSHE